jgi:hypothetical protein
MGDIPIHRLLRRGSHAAVATTSRILTSFAGPIPSTRIRSGNEPAQTIQAALPTLGMATRVPRGTRLLPVTAHRPHHPAGAQRRPAPTTRLGLGRHASSTSGLGPTSGRLLAAARDRRPANPVQRGCRVQLGVEKLHKARWSADRFRSCIWVLVGIYAVVVVAFGGADTTSSSQACRRRAHLDLYLPKASGRSGD